MNQMFQRESRSKRLLLPMALLALVLALALTCNTNQAANEPVLVLSDVYDTPYTTASADGFLDVLLKEAFRRAGLNLKIVKVSPERALLNANAGIEDGLTPRISGLEKNYPNLVRVPEKVMDVSFVAFAGPTKLTNAKLLNANWESLAAVSVGYLQGYKIFEQSLKPGTQITIVDTAEQLFTMLDKNRIDVVLYERWQGLALAKKMGIEGVRMVEPALAEQEMFVYLNKRHADKIPAISAALRALKADGFYSRICREKFAPLAASTKQCEVK